MKTTRRTMLYGGLAALSWSGNAAAQDSGAPNLSPLIQIRSPLYHFTSADDATCFSPNGTRILSRTLHQAYLFDSATGEEISELRHGGWDTAEAVFSPNGRFVATATGGQTLLATDRTARVWDSVTGRRVAVLGGHESRVNGASFSPDSARILTWDNDAAYVWDAARRRRLATLRGNTALMFGAEFSADGSSVLTRAFERTARLFDTNTWRERAVLQLDNTRPEARFTADGARIATFTYGGSAIAQLWDARTGAAIANLRGRNGALQELTLSRDGARIATTSSDDAVRLWDAADGRELAALPGHGDRAYAMAFSPDSQRIVTSSDDGVVRLWEAASGRELAVMPGHERTHIVKAKFNTDGTRVITYSTDGSARLWDADGRAVAVLPHSEHEAVYSADFNADGARIVTASQSRVLVWPMA